MRFMFPLLIFFSKNNIAYDFADYHKFDFEGNKENGKETSLHLPIALAYFCPCPIKLTVKGKIDSYLSLELYQITHL